MTKHDLISSATMTDDYSSTATNLCYNHDDLYYNSHHHLSQTNYPNFTLYTSPANYLNSHCCSTYSNLDNDNKSSSYSSSPMYNSVYYDQQQSNDYHLLSSKITSKQLQHHQMISNKKKQTLSVPSSYQQTQQQIKRGFSCETLPSCDVNNKQVRLDNGSEHHHLSHTDYETNLPSDKIDLYLPTNHCYASTNYPTEHPYNHTSVIIDTQQYFLNGWNGTPAF